MPPKPNKQKLELTWIGKENRPKLEPRILVEDPEKSYHASHRVGANDLFDNILLRGDNLLGLKALEGQYAGKVKCIFIDPPYNTGSAFEHYDDGVEHSIWLSLMRERLQLLKRLLAEDGSIWITVDDNEAHYLKLMGDEVFGRANFVTNVIWQKKYAPANDAKWLSDDHDHLLIFAKNKQIWRPNKLPRTEAQNKLYLNPDDDPRGPWMSDNYTCAKSIDERPNLYYPITNPNTGKEILPKKTRVWAFDQKAHQRHVRENMIYWGKTGENGTPRLKKFISQLKDKGRVSSTIWLYDEVGHTQDARREVLALNPIDPFATPKPEALIRRIIEIGSSPGDLVLDSFLGSGTTAAVAHKMGRRWIGIELGEHCETHCLPRLKKVIDGEDPGGITKAVKLERRRRLPLLPARALASRKGQMGQLGNQQGIQRRHAGRGGLQAGGLHLCAKRQSLLAARPLHGGGFHLRHHGQPHSRPTPAIERRGRLRRPNLARRLHFLPRQQGRLSESDSEKDPQSRALPLRMGQGRLQLACRESPRRSTETRPAGIILIYPS